MKELPKAYNPADYEDKIYHEWEEHKLFNPDTVKRAAEPFCIVLPPPNVTGTLHLGHAAMLAIEDLMIRYKRMQGYDTLWLPGTDHASIATQNVVEKKLAKQGITRHDLGRKKFLAAVEEFVDQSKNTIKNQTRKMGSSLDWDREAYTLDETRSRAVRKVFKMMYDDGLIYRGYRIVNWCPRCQSTLADDEVDHQEAEAKIYYFKYDKDFPFTIATTRPETKLGDTAVAVNPADDRYQKYIGQTIEARFAGQKLKLKIIADPAVDPQFGTGALGVTPAHSLIDYEIAQKHDLPIIKIIDEQGKIATTVEQYGGLSVLEARTAIINELEAQGLLEKVEDVKHNLSLCYRCATPIEPLPSKQWFVDVNKKCERLHGLSLKQQAIDAVKNGSIKIIPERFNKIYYNWMENLHDWCISRQLWFGHRIPVWYRHGRSAEPEIYVGEDEPAGAGWVQDEDTLDTWFSAGLWTFSTLLAKDFIDFDKEKNPDLKRFHPTMVLETAADILFFWVARMILMTNYVMNEPPFKNVYLHGIIKDKHGKKMSKSRPETAIDPLIVGGKYGFDAVRLSLLIGSAPGNDLRLYDEKIAGYRNFVNKLWNVSRYILMSVENVKLEQPTAAATLADRWILSRFNQLKQQAAKLLDEFDFSNAGQALYDFTWNELADWYLEIAKIEKNKDAILIYILKDLLKMWHPFTPFVTQALWPRLETGEELMVSCWPSVDAALIDPPAEQEFETVRAIITKIRNLRSDYKVEPGKKITVQFKTAAKPRLSPLEPIIAGLARAAAIEYVDHQPEQSAGAVVGGVEIYLPLAQMVEPAKERARLEKEIDNLTKYISGVEKKLSNDSFVNNAPQEVVATEKRKLEQAKIEVDKLNHQINSLI